LVLVLAPVFGVEELQVEGGAVVAAEFHFVAQTFGAIEDVAFVEVVEDAFEFGVAELNAVMFFELGFEESWVSSFFRCPFCPFSPFVIDFSYRAILAEVLSALWLNRFAPV
jgi:hypothetical protein